ncbi:hypothetical protein CSA37_03940 [Candidatus Fermentibacteria bacterium]|nr:MAG: hypothetical protein CSA37_10775 [Candidatus Fermentibacteria bacterium]PIE52803.1 MAG: hypothetical protein CSA37_03940 [Candidatus Fermentibacteria bacterium]
MDWDGDGRLDIIVGDRPGNVHFFKRLDSGTVEMEEQGLLTAAGNRIEIDYNSAPSVTDWNSDGLPDLVIGALSPFPAGIYLLVNEGSPFQPDFPLIDTVFCNGEPIDLSTAYPDFHDMTGDGLQDMIAGSNNGRVACFVNSGTEEAPLFNYFENVKADGVELNLGSYVRPTVCDWNSDGTPDLLVGETSGLIHIYTGIPETGIHSFELQPELCVTNPSFGSVNMELTLPCPSQFLFEIYSLSGRKLHTTRSGMLSEGHNSISLPVQGLQYGCYLLRARSDTGIELNSTVMVIR